MTLNLVLNLDATNSIGRCSIRILYAEVLSIKRFTCEYIVLDLFLLQYNDHVHVLFGGTKMT